MELGQNSSNFYGRSWKDDLDQSIDPRFDSTFPVAKITEIDPEFIGKWKLTKPRLSQKICQGKKAETEEEMEKFMVVILKKKVIEERTTIRIPEDLYDHQKVGLRLWQESGMRGILEYATGSGKTITAIAL